MYAKSPFVSRSEVRTLVTSLNTGSRISFKPHSSTICLEKQINSTVSVPSITEPSSTPYEIKNENDLIMPAHMIPESSVLLTPNNIFPLKSNYYDTMKMLYKEAEGDNKIFQTNECGIMISKMLSKVYEDRSSFELSVKNISYWHHKK